MSKTHQPSLPVRRQAQILPFRATPTTMPRGLCITSRIAGISLMLALVPGLVSRADAPKKAVSPVGVQFFESKVRPLLVENCYKCHADKKQRGGLRVDSRDALLQGGDQGPALVPGDPEKSLLVKAVRHADKDLKMPPDRKLAKEQVADLVQWIQMGAPWPSAEKTAVARKGEFQISAKDRAHWSFQPVKRPALPQVKDRAWGTRPIDAFILAGLEAKGLQPNPPAAKQELVRRLYYDLTGLPPTPQEVETYLADPAPDAYEKLIDKLLDSPRYGEKWGRYWLDLVHYAETNSYERDNPKPHVWRYRDYVIRSFNQDKPYNQFLAEQLAGDELGRGNPEALIATGYYRLGIWDDEPSDPLQARYDMLDDIVATTGQVFLGLTLDCARCHNHKIDPIAQKDYYRFLAYFHNINHYRNGGPTDEAMIFDTPEARQRAEQALRDQDERRQQLQGKIEAIEKEFLARAGEKQTFAPIDFAQYIKSRGADVLGQARYGDYVRLRRQLESAKKETPPGVEKCLCVTETGRTAPPTQVLLRGNPHVKGEVVEPGLPLVFNLPDPPLPAPEPAAKTTGRRTVLARWLASPDNPLTARVMANRIWQYHFGRGIVRTPNDFGLHGARPTHPDLLDWLASELVQHDWRFKPLHRQILTSNAYRMSSRANSQGLAADPANDRSWRFDMRRLTAEEIRDSILAVSGNLSLKMFGPGVYPEIPREVLQGQSMPGRGWNKSSPDEANRRSIYVHVKRSLLLPILESFDLAETDRTTPVRFATTQPTQALGMLNGDFLNQQAALFAGRLKREAGSDPTKQVRLALYLATQRQPGEADMRRGIDLIQALQKRDGVSADAALNIFCLLALNLNEFMYLD